MGIKQPFSPQDLGDTGLPISDYGDMDILIKDRCSLSIKVLLRLAVSPSTTSMVTRLAASGIPALCLTFMWLMSDASISSRGS